MHSMKDLGFKAGDDFDNTPAWNAMVAGGYRHVIIDNTYTFKTKPNPVTSPLRLEGATINTASLFRDYQPSEPTEAFLDFHATVRFDGAAVLATSGQGGLGVRFRGLGASGSVIRDSYISSKSADANWLVPLTYYSEEDLGIRSCIASNVELFAATGHLLWAVNPRGLTLENVNCYPAGGTVGHATIQNYKGHRAAAVRWNTRYLEAVWVYGTDGLLIDAMAPVSINPFNSSQIVARVN